MQIRSSIYLSGNTRKLILVSQETETAEHMALKLAGCILFFKSNPVLEISVKHPALNNQEFKPDLVVLNDAGEVKVWIECGNVATHKLEKIIRRFREARIVVLKSSKNDAKNLRRALDKHEVTHAERVEILSFPEGQFEPWNRAMEESVEVFGEEADRSFNLVANGAAFSFDFVQS